MEAKREARDRVRSVDPLSFVDPAAVAEALLDDARESLVASRAAVDLLEQRSAGRTEA